MRKNKPDDQYSDEETQRRMDEALRKALATPPKVHKEMIGKSGRKTGVRKRRSSINKA
jgi:hypothetical protein